MTFWDYHGRDPKKSNPLGLNIDDAYDNHAMDVNSHWNTAIPEDSEKQAWSVWEVTPESSDDKISAITVSSELTAKGGEQSGEFATVQWALDAEGPWNDVYTHSFPENTNKWMRRGESGQFTLDEPASTVYLRMVLDPRGRGLMWWEWKVIGRTVDDGQ